MLYLAVFEAGLVLIGIVVITLPIAAIVFARGAGGALDEIGRGEMSIGADGPAAEAGLTDSGAGGSAVRDEEIRQMVTARSYRAEQRGEPALDIDAEVEKLLSADTSNRPLGADRGLREEVRGLVIARNERRERSGKVPLDVESEIDRQLAELENLGQ